MSSKIEHPAENIVDRSLQEFPIIARAFHGFNNLFFKRKFGAHRIMGLMYLIQYAAVIFMFAYDYQGMFLKSPLIITLPISGIIQTTIAIYTFTFLPKKSKDSGYFSDKGVMSYPFLVENLFFVTLLCFQWLYYNDLLYPYIKKFFVLEYGFVFLPYLFRFLSPKTSIRDALGTTQNYTTEGNRSWFFYAGWATKCFYLWAKHYIGFFLNYVRFINVTSSYDQYCVFLILISSCFATTIAMFLHTLRFRGYLPPRVSFGSYVAGYSSTFIGYGMIFYIFFKHPALTLITFVGLFLNLYSLKVWHVYQIGLMLSFHFGLINSTW